MHVGIGVAFMAGLVSFLSPCVLPIVPVYLAYLTGATYGELATGSHRWRTISHALAFIAGFSIVFITLGASASFVGQLLFANQKIVEMIGGAFLLVLGLWMTGLIPIGFLYRDIRVHMAQKPTGYAGSVLVGAAFAAGWTPCVGPVLSGILYLASKSNSVGYGILLLSFYSLGLAVPLLLCCLALESSLRLIKRMGPILPMIEKGTGVCLALMGALLLSGKFTRVSSWMLSYFSGWTKALNALGY
ncbi:MAG: cytochrome c biogenesis protein CcdA [Elusimicrobia bacterium]|nr:cytochrome c biogenesis protein CcdA [Elusimicrobiota bacterium]